ncbi:MAG: helix-turn-helix domain-containing protein [Acetobacteraceae bacterium]|nr:helix-turn-helix domain-containing protein [Acetobacteraceae bacterium]
MTTRGRARRIQSAEAAGLLGVSQRTVQMMLARGDLPGARVGARWTTTVEDIDTYLRQHANAPTRPYLPAWKQTEAARVVVSEATDRRYRELLGLGPRQPEAAGQAAANQRTRAGRGQAGKTQATLIHPPPQRRDR